MKLLQPALLLSSFTSLLFNANSKSTSNELPALGQFLNKTDGRYQNFISMSSVTMPGKDSISYLEQITGLKFGLTMKMSKEDYEQSIKEGNCYNFVTSTTSEPGSTERLPGDLYSHKKYDCTVIGKAVLQDSNMRAENFSENCGSNEREIFVFVGELDSEESRFHFIATDEHGIYRDKLGGNPSREVPSTLIENGVIFKKPSVRLITNKDDVVIDAVIDETSIEYKLCPEKYCYDLTQAFKHDEL